MSPASVVKVGNGRGFVIVNRAKVPPLKAHQKRLPRGISSFRFAEHRLIVTAAHCLPNMPPGQPSFPHERTYPSLLGALGGSCDGSRNRVWAECLFVDPISDVAILGCPDEQELGDEADAYHALVDGVPVARIGKASSARGWLLALSGDHWVPTALELFSTCWGTQLKTRPTEAGMSGSPILNDAGRAVGIVSTGSATVEDGVRNEDAGPQPILAHTLPGWLLPINAR
jgi:Trypsin-like peptidase domain